MPVYTVTDPKTGKTLDMTGDSPPTAAEIGLAFTKAYPPASGLSAFFEQHPNVAALARGTANVLPGAGAVLGGALGASAAPVSLGLGAIPGVTAGAALGAGAGRGLRDLATEGLGLEPVTSPFQKGVGIAGEAALTAAVPGVIEAARTPIRSLAEFTDAARKLLPRAVQPQFLQDLPKWLEQLKTAAPAEASTLTRPAWQSATEAISPAEPAMTSQSPSALPGPPKVRITAEDVRQVQALVARGMKQDAAIKLVWGLKTSPVFAPFTK